MSKPIDQERELFEVEACKRFGYAPISIASRRKGDGYDDPSLSMALVMWNASAQQSAGGAVPDLQKLREVWLFLDGRGELDGASFGDVPEGANRFWWRKHLRAAVEPILATAPHPVSGEQKAQDVADLPPFAVKVIAKLRRFEECAGDPDSGGVDIGRNWLDLLTQLGLLIRARIRPAYWEISNKGEEVLAAHRAQQGGAE